MTRSQILELLAGIPQSGARLGSVKAPVMLTLYGDLECPICREFVLGKGFAKLVAHDVRSGKVKVIYRGLRTASPTFRVFVRQQAAALAAGQQGRFWQFAMIFLKQQGAEGTDYVTKAFLNNIAQQIPGLNFHAWQSARAEDRLTAQVRADNQSGTRIGVDSTPTLIFRGPRGSSAPLSPAPGYAGLLRAIKEVS